MSLDNMKMDVSISRLEEIVGDNNELKKSLLEMFISNFNKILSALESHLNLSPEELPAKWHESCHELKGAALNLGFEDLAKYCKHIETFKMSRGERLSALEDLKIARNDLELLMQSMSI